MGYNQYGQWETGPYQPPFIAQPKPVAAKVTYPLQSHELNVLRDARKDFTSKVTGLVKIVKKWHDTNIKVFPRAKSIFEDTKNMEKKMGGWMDEQERRREVLINELANVVDASWNSTGTWHGYEEEVSRNSAVMSMPESKRFIGDFKWNDDQIYEALRQCNEAGKTWQALWAKAEPYKWKITPHDLGAFHNANMQGSVLCSEGQLSQMRLLLPLC